VKPGAWAGHQGVPGIILFAWSEGKLASAVDGVALGYLEMLRNRAHRSRSSTASVRGDTKGRYLSLGRGGGGGGRKLHAASREMPLLPTGAVRPLPEGFSKVVKKPLPGYKSPNPSQVLQYISIRGSCVLLCIRGDTRNKIHKRFQRHESTPVHEWRSEVGLLRPYDTVQGARVSVAGDVFEVL